MVPPVVPALPPVPVQTDGVVASNWSLHSHCKPLSPLPTAAVCAARRAGACLRSPRLGCSLLGARHSVWSGAPSLGPLPGAVWLCYCLATHIQPSYLSFLIRTGPTS